MKKAPVTAEAVKNMFPNKFDRVSKAKASMERLSICGLLKPVSDGWQITPSGMDYLRVTAKAYKGEMK
jgi:hypothetical protein